MPPPKMSTHDSAFPQHLIDHGIRECCHIYGDSDDESDDQHDIFMPTNFEEIMNELQIPRDSMLTPKDLKKDFKSYKEFMAHKTTSESQVMSRRVLGYLTGTHGFDISNVAKIPFGKLAPLTDGTLADAVPDFYDGAATEELNSGARKILGQYVVPATGSGRPIAPNFFLEAKGPRGATATAKAKAFYDGALGARAMQYLRSYTGRNVELANLVYDNIAYAITSYFDGNTLVMFTVHLTPPEPPSNRPLYHLNKLLGVYMTGTLQDYWRGVTMFRNARDWARKARDELIKQANNKKIEIEAEISIPNTSLRRRRATVVNEGSGSNHVQSPDRALEVILEDEEETTRRGKRRKIASEE
jgi:hypothetical protein